MLLSIPTRAEENALIMMIISGQRKNREPGWALQNIVFNKGQHAERGKIKNGLQEKQITIDTDALLVS